MSISFCKLMLKKMGSQQSYKTAIILPTCTEHLVITPIPMVTLSTVPSFIYDTGMLKCIIPYPFPSTYFEEVILTCIVTDAVCPGEFVLSI